MSPGILSPGGSPQRGRGGGKSPKGKGKGTSKATFRYSKPPGKPADPKGRARTMTCLRCGQPGHFAAQCPAKGSASGASQQGTKRSAPTESAVLTEGAHVTFVDAGGHERPDVTMLDPGASAFLSGFGPFFRYLDFLKAHQFPIHDIEFNKCCRKFHFGGDGASWSHWVVRLPMCVGGIVGRAQVFLVKGETPLLCGRPIMEALGISLDFASKSIRFSNGPWQPATIGAHGEYLLPLWEPGEPLDFANLDFQFDLQVAGDGEVDPKPMSLAQFEEEEQVMNVSENNSDVPSDAGDLPLPRHQLKTLDVKLAELHNDYHGYVTSELHSKTKRVIWEVYCGRARTSEIAESLGATVETFSFETGWNFNLQDHRSAFLRRLEAEVPDELFLAPTCAPWSPMQNLAARDDEQKQRLQELREWHHGTHLVFVRKAYETQIRNGGHAHLEQPAFALSWKTKSLSALPGIQARFDQCQYGCQCLDFDNIWKPVRKPTIILTSKQYMAQQLNRLCSKDHQHCQLEGSAPGLGRRTRYMEDYQPGLAAVLASAMMHPEPPSLINFVGAVNEDREYTSGIIRLLTTNKPEAARVVQRLHRNLGHPEPQRLVELLQSRGASSEVIEAARNYHCVACQRYRRPNATAPALLPEQTLSFNGNLQADVLWFKLKDKKVPVLSMVDSATKFQAGAVIYGERSSDFIHALERGWIRHFGPPTTLVSDEGRGWASDEMLAWTSSHNIQHLIAPGEAHTRLSLVERRHAILRKAVEIYMDDLGLTSIDGLRQALAYVLPQVNSNPNVAGFSPAQWVLGFQPKFPGDLTSEGLNPGHLDGSATFEQVLQSRASAKQALTKADADRRLRRALLRRYAGTNTALEPGQNCFYWRDARHGDLVKIRWLGPAKVVLREDEPSSGKPSLYWIAHGTQLLRCAPHHVRADFRTASRETIVDGLTEARKIVMDLKSRGVTRFVDLGRANKRQIDDVASDEEADEDLDFGTLEPPLRRPRVDDEPDLSPQPEQPLQQPAAPVEHIPDHDSQAETEDYTPSVGPPQPTAAEPGDMNIEPAAVPTTPSPGGEPTPVDADAFLDALEDEQEPGQEPSAAPSPTSMPSSSQTQLQLDPSFASLYERADGEDFASRRARIDRQETQLYGPLRETSRPSVTPYAPPMTPVPESESFSQSFYVQEVENTALPSGWTMDSDGFFQLQDSPMDFWEVKAGCLIRHHLRPRRNLFQINKNLDVPLDPALLDPVRITVIRTPSGLVETINDTGLESKTYPTPWLGYTIFQISGRARRELCMYSNLPAKKVAKDVKVKLDRQKKKVDKGGVSERLLTLEEKLQFQQAKQKELRSFFENQVWEFDSASNADPSRTMTARMLLKWSKNDDGSPRAKARLIVRGYTDVDALQGSLETASPTTTRLSRSFLLSLSSILGWSLWTSDIATAFLQGLPQERKLWVKLPAECVQLLGASEDCRMLLVKPVYGQLDAPRRWYLEAVRRLRSLGLRQHLLDPCTFLIYDADHRLPEDGPGPPVDSTTLGESGLCGMICLHVDDMLGAGDPSSIVYQRVIKKLQELFSFRQWKDGSDGSSFEYCGADIDKLPDGTLKLHHGSYYKKVKPMTIPKHLGPESELSSKEITSLRGLLGALQWPAVQSAPHLQASTSIYSGSVSRGLVKTALEANRLLKFAKDNSDVGLTYAPLSLADLCIVTAFDASFGCRPDGTSQGGYVVMLAPRMILESGEAPYHILDWRSCKLPRVARSSLAAESQAAACAADATEFVCRYYEHLRCPDLKLAELLRQGSSLKPVLVTDAKALYDSYHRESLISSVTDRRVSLEIRVVKEQMQSVSGSLRWVSSERQLADGLTKDSARQLLADRLRHGRIKFLWDPDYVAAKKKPLQERLRSQEEGSKKKKKLKGILETVDEAAPESNDVDQPLEVTDSKDVVVDEQTLVNDEVIENDSTGVYVVFTTEPVIYVDAAGQNRGKRHGGMFEYALKMFLKAVDKMRRFFFTVFLFGLFPVSEGVDSESCLVPHSLAPLTVHVNQSSGENFLGYSILVLAAILTIAAVISAGVAWHYRQENRRLRMMIIAADRKANAFALVLPRIEREYDDGMDRVDELRYQNRGAFATVPRDLGDALNVLVDHQHVREQGVHVARRAIEETEAHANMCPYRVPIYTTARGEVWHLNRNCSSLRTAIAAERRPCRLCSDRRVTPHYFDGSGTTLLTELEHFVEEANSLI